MTEWLDALGELRRARRPGALVTVVTAEGSTPREVGAKMVVDANAVRGTIGGGNLEHRATALARDLLTAGGAPRLERFSLGPSLGQCCGGAVGLLIERVDPDAGWPARAAELSRAGQAFGLETDLATGAKRLLAGDLPLPPGETVAASGADERAVVVEAVRPPDLDIVLFGAGHVGRALVTVLGQLPCRVTWVDQRDDQFPVGIPPNVLRCSTAAPEGQVRQARRGSYFLVMTHSHAVDQALCEAILERGDFAYLGLIGSTTKRRRFEKRFRARGLPEERIRRLTCPIGLADIPDKHPGAIAVAVAAEILETHAARRSAAAPPAPQPAGAQA